MEILIFNLWCTNYNVKQTKNCTSGHVLYIYETQFKFVLYKKKCVCFGKEIIFLLYSMVSIMDEDLAGVGVADGTLFFPDKYYECTLQ